LGVLTNGRRYRAVWPSLPADKSRPVRCGFSNGQGRACSDRPDAQAQGGAAINLHRLVGINSCRQQLATQHQDRSAGAGGYSAGGAGGRVDHLGAEGLLAMGKLAI